MDQTKKPDQSDRRAVLEQALRTIETLQAKLDAAQKEKTEPIAVIGLGCRFPGDANDADSYWKLLCDGVDAIRDIPQDRWNVNAFYDPDPDAPGKMYSKRGGFIKDVDKFDASFFGISAQEAARTDPQQRILLEVTWEALEHAAVLPESLAGSQTGVFVGITTTDYLRIVEQSSSLDAYHLTGNCLNFAAGRIAYVLGLRGPAMAVDTACSASAVAVHLACQSLRNRECNLGIAGGVNLILSPELNISASKAGMLSPDGACKTFDGSANGYVRSEGCGIVILKRLTDALADGDNILALIRGSAVNQDGAGSGITVPNKLAQIEVIHQALDRGGVRPQEVSYVETHGTGTPLGDPIEVRALASVYGGGRSADQPLLLGSVKTNIGHLESAAGIAGLIKVILCLQHGMIPPHLHFQQLNPAISLQEIPATIPTHTISWNPANGPRIAGLSSFGASGTIVHMVLEEAQREDTAGDHQTAAPSNRADLLTLSARSSDALAALAKSYREALRHQSPDDAHLRRICFTANVRRSHHRHRLAVVGRTWQDFANRLENYLQGNAQDHSYGHVSQATPQGPIFVFPGHGSQWLGMGRSLLGTEPVFREMVSRCDAAFRAHLNCSLLDEVSDLEFQSRLEDTEFAHAAIFSLQVALAALFRSWGITPGGVIGHSIGEVSAAFVAGALSFEDAVRVITSRGRLMRNADSSGRMASVELGASKIEQIISPVQGRLSVAAINGPDTSVVSGNSEAIEHLLQSLQAQNIACYLLPGNYAFHSSFMDPLEQQLVNALRDVHPRSSSVPMFSSVTASACDGSDLGSEYWWRNLRETVRFSGAINEALRANHSVFLEMGGQSILSRSIAELLERNGTKGLALPTLRRGHDERTALLSSLGSLYIHGYRVDWNKFYPSQLRPVDLPRYPWQRKRFWLDRPSRLADPPRDESAALTPLGTATVDAHAHSTPGVGTMQSNVNAATSPDARKQKVLAMLVDILHELSGIESSDIQPEISFIEIGLDSLFLTQASHALSAKFGVKISIRQMMEDLYTPDRAAAYLADKSTIALENAGGAAPQQQIATAFSANAYSPSAPDSDLGCEQRSAPTAPSSAEANLGTQVAPPAMPEFAQSASPAASLPPRVVTESLSGARTVSNRLEESAIERLIHDQIELLNRQLDMMRGLAVAPSPSGEQRDRVEVPPPPLVAPIASSPVGGQNPRKEPQSGQKESSGEARFRPITRESTSLTDRQRENLEAFVIRYTRRTRESKRQTELHRPYFADHRSVMGFRQLRKEMIYPIVSVRSAGSKLWDVDGNEYVDFITGFGANLFGHMPPFVRQAVEEQLKLGIEVGPQTPWAGKVAKLISELTGCERVAFCNTGSEAVMGALRLARAATGRDKVVTFDNDYHGNFDEVLIRRPGGKNSQGAAPVAPGVPRGTLGNITVLECGSSRSVEILRSIAPELAAVLVEPIHFRTPERWPRELLQEIRAITESAGTALIFDELITGFRIHQGGAQAYFGIDADLVTYGKVVGGGMPIGVVAGKSRFMDHFDGGFWKYGDDSIPEVGITFFDGTFARNPLSMAAAYAVMEHLKNCGPELQEKLNERTEKLVATLRAITDELKVPLHIYHTGSIFYIHIPPELPFGSLLFYYLRDKGIHAWEHRSWILSTEHSDADLQHLVDAFRESLREMIAADFFPGDPDRPHPSGSKPRLETELVPAQSPILATPVAVKEAPSVSVSPRTEWKVPIAASTSATKFSLYFFGNYPAPFSPDKYRMLFEAARFGDAHGFEALWMPERHFHAVGGFSPNPAVVAAALARETRRIQLRAGSVVLPLHNPIRVAEEWSVVDNLSQGRVGLSVASGWHPNDFVFAPDAFERRRELCEEGIALIRKLWSGQTITVRGGKGNALNVSLVPMPVQPELPVWLTCTSTATYEKAGELGTGVLAMLTNHSLDELAEKLALYRRSREQHGFDPATGNVTLLIHTFVDNDYSRALAKARGPMREYLRSYLDNSQKRFDAGGAQTLDKESLEYLLDRAFEDYVKGKALIGTPETCQAVVDKLRAIGADELGCFIDFGVDLESALAALPHLAELKRVCDARASNTSTSPATHIRERPLEIVACPADRNLPLLDSQQGLLLLAQMTPQANRAYVETTTIEINGPLDIDLLKQSFQAVIDRHEATRVTIDPSGESQTVHDHLVFDVPSVDLRSLQEQQRQSLLSEQFAEIESRVFDLQRGPALGAHIFWIADDRALLVISFHHLFGNGPSYEVLVKNLSEAYASLAKGKQPRFAPAMQLTDYVRWRQEKSSGPAYEQDRRFWAEQFSDSLPVLDLPPDRPRPSVFSFCGGRESLTFDSAFTAMLRQMSKDLRSSLFVGLLAGFNALLHRLSGQNTLIAGVPFEGEVRTLPGGAELFANTTNVLPLRSTLAPGVTFADFLSATRSYVYEATEHQSYFFGHLTRDLKVRPDLGRPPIIAALFNVDHALAYSRSCGDVSFKLLLEDVPAASPRDTAKFDISINVVEKSDELRIDCDYNKDLFDGSTIALWLRYYQTLLAAAAANPAQQVNQLPLLPAEEMEKLREWNDTTVVYSNGNLCVHQIIEQQVQRTPDQVAVIFEEQQLTYAELDRRANQLAHHLKKRGVGPESLVAVFAERSLEMIVALLGIWKAGGAYVPVDPEYPSERVAFMLQDAGAPILLTQARLVDRLPQGIQTAVLPLDEDWPEIAREQSSEPVSAAGPDHLAYMIYTSGSTGKPKGAMNTHRGITNRLLWMQEQYQLTEQDRVLQKTPFSFDVSVWEFFWPLMTGACLVLAQPGGHKDPQYLANIIVERQITTMHFVPSMLRVFLEADEVKRCVNLRQVFCSGEALPFSLQEQFFKLLPAQLYNLYGPTEAAVDVTYWNCQRDSERQIVPIGWPVANTRIHILDRQQQLLPIGVPGELYIGGVQVARGYHKRPELTAERFIADPFSANGGRLYKTGDLCRRLADGTVEYLGRLDFQVKIRGLRIELGEIESALLEREGVQNAAVVAKEDQSGEVRLVAYYVLEQNASDGSSGGPEELRGYLATRLPEYMVPAAYVKLDALPLAVNGKLDSRALPDPERTAYATRGFEEPVDGMETRLAEIWAELLHVERVGRQDNFFELGGHSLLAVSMMGRLGLKTNISALFAAPTLASWAAIIGRDCPEITISGTPIPSVAKHTDYSSPMVDLTI